MKCSLCGNFFDNSTDNKCPHCGQTTVNWQTTQALPSLEWQSACGGFDGSTTRPYNVSAFKHGLRIRDVGLQGSAQLALRSDVFDADGNLYSRTATNTIKKFSTAQGFIDVATCLLQGEVVSNLALYQGSIYVTLDSGFLAKIDCHTMTAVYLNLTKLVSDAYADVNLLPPKNLIFANGYAIFAGVDRLFRLELNTAALSSVLFKDTQLCQTAIVWEATIFVVSRRCEIHKVDLNQFFDLAFEVNADNTASFYRRGFAPPQALVYANGALHFRLQMADAANQDKLYYVCIDKFPEGQVFAVANDTCRARFVLPSVVGDKVYVGANAYYSMTDKQSVLVCDSPTQSHCTRSCQKIPAGCDSKAAPQIHFYGDGVGKIGHELYPGQIAFLNQRVSMFQSLKVKGQHKYFVITAVFKDYFAARSNDSNVYILERADEV